MTKIMLDAGHGGNDPGAIGHGIQEKDVCLKIVKKIQQQLQNYEGVQVRLTRDKDEFLTLTQRSNLSNSWGSDLFVSVHINAHNDNTANGFETFIYNGTVSSRTIAFQNVIHPAILKEVGLRDRGKKRANFAVLRQTNASAILTENGFINNASDASKLKNDAFLDKVAKGHVDGMVQFLGLKRKATPEPTPTRPTTDTDDLFRVQVGAFSSRENAERLLKSLHEKGFKDAFIK